MSKNNKIYNKINLEKLMIKMKINRLKLTNINKIMMKKNMVKKISKMSNKIMIIPN